MRKATYILLGVAVVIIFGLFNSVYVVDERKTALVLQFGRVVAVKEQPGLGFKIPFIQHVVAYDDRILSIDTDPLEVTPLDDRRLVVDAFARYRIADVRKFREAVGTGGVGLAEDRLDSILRSQTREVLGSVSSNDILSSDRAALMLRIRNNAITEARNLGLEVIDVRLKRTDLPRENLDATFARMRAEREREAADEVARGNEAAQRVRAQADRTNVEIVSDAKRQSEITRGEADAQRSAIFAKAFDADRKFFAFYRSLSAYRAALKTDNSRMVLSPDSEFFKYLKDDGGSLDASLAAQNDVAMDTPATGTPANAAKPGSSTVNTAAPDTAKPDTAAPGIAAPESGPKADQSGAEPSGDSQSAPDQSVPVPAQ